MTELRLALRRARGVVSGACRLYRRTRAGSAPVLEVIQTFDEIDAAVSLGLDVEEMIEGLAKPLRNALEKSTRTSTLVMSTEHDA